VKLRVVATLALALCLLGCGIGEQVPLFTVETVVADGGCVLLYQVVDVIADPMSGTPAIKGGGEPLRWPRGYTARRAGLEVEVLDPAGTVVLTTGGRYWMCPKEYLPEWVIGRVRPCPDCELGQGVL
jgi:hypothetical protein